MTAVIIAESLPGPIVVGGNGGSGTRVVAQILMGAGVFLGSDLNAANDNLWFTLLLKRAAWRRRMKRDDPEAIGKHLEVLGKVLLGMELKAQEVALAADAATDISLHGHDHLGSGKGSWPFLRVASMIDSPGADPSTHWAWGWKEPNSHIYIEELATTFPGLRYIHVIRHGLDMAYGYNLTQVHLWAGEFGFDSPAAKCPPDLALRFWIASNRHAIDLGKQMLGDRFVLLNYDDLCVHPTEGVEGLLGPLGLRPSRGVLEELARIPERQLSTGRFVTADLSVHTAAELEAVRELGFSVPPPF